LLPKVINIAQHAADIILNHYGSIDFQQKKDHSPVTKADLEANHYIVQQLQQQFTYPILSEEAPVPYKIRQTWQTLWLVDPLDGTKDFLTQTGDFTVNIALIHQGRPYLGVVVCPVSGVIYSAQKGHGAFKQGERIMNESFRMGKNIIGVDSRHFSTPATKGFFQKNHIEHIEHYGSSLKMCKVAEGVADIYPRLNGTMEWDTGASDIILTEAGCALHHHKTRQPLTYNRPDLLNPHFIAYRRNLIWS